VITSAACGLIRFYPFRVAGKKEFPMRQHVIRAFGVGAVAVAAILPFSLAVSAGAASPRRVGRVP